MDSLPLEIFQIIVDYLDARSRLFARLTSTDWFKMIQITDYTFCYIRQKQLPVIIRRMSDYAHALGITFKKSRLRAPLSDASSQDTNEFLELAILTNLTRLSIPDQEFDWPSKAQWMHFSTLTNLESLEIKEKSHMPYKTLLRHLPNITSVDIRDSLSLARVFVKMTNLQHLQLDIGSGLNFVKLMPELEYPGKLTSLVICGYNAPSMTVTDDMVTCLTGLKHLTCHSHRLTFPHHLLPNLESLEVVYSSDHIGMNSNLTKLKFVLPESQIEGLTNLIKLQSLSIQYDLSQQFEQIDFLTAMTDLQELDLVGARLKVSMDLLCPFINSTKFTKLTLHGRRITITEKVSQLTNLQSLTLQGRSGLGWLTYLTNLTSLESTSGEDYHEGYVSKLTALKRLVIKCQDPIKFDYDFNVADLTNLEQLTLEMKFKSGTIQGLDLLTGLKSLALHVNVEIGSNFLQKMTELTSVYINSEKLSWFWSTISTITALRDLRIIDSFADESHALMLQPLTLLTRLNLPMHLSNETWENFTHIYQLKYLK